jgi:hypothetical protein
VKVSAIQKILSRALWKQDLRQPLQKGARRNPWKLAHGLRKAFRSKAGLVMHHLNVELIMGHKTTGTQETYWRPTEEEVLEDYLKAVNLLTINNNVQKFEIEQIHDKEIEELKARQTVFESVLKKMVASDMCVDINDPEEQERIASVPEKVLAGKRRLFTDE